MADVVFDEEAKRNRRVVSDYALCSQFSLGDVVDHGHENLVLGFPPGQEHAPRLVGVAMDVDPGVLRILGSAVLAVDRGADEALAIVRG